MGKVIASRVQSFVTNIDIDHIVNLDLSGTQFDPELLMDEARKIGLDFGELEDYGIKVNKNCGNTCPNSGSFFLELDRLMNGESDHSLLESKMLSQY